MTDGAPKDKTIMLMSSNGAGLGHLTRLMAIGRHLTPRCNVIIFTLSRAVDVPTKLGYPVEYFPSRSQAESTALWNRRLRHRVEHLLELYSVDALVFDGTFPYGGLMRALDQSRHVRSFWVRRGMWKPAIGDISLAKSDSFNEVIEPGDFAGAADQGLTSEAPADLVTSPIVLQPSEQRQRSVARRELGIGDEATAVLLLLGAGQINDTDSLTSSIVNELLRHPGIEVVVGQSALSSQGLTLPDRVRVASLYPISAYFAAFDFAAMAAGYNSFHEALAFRLPTLFVPNMETKTDDQFARAQWGHRAGMNALYVEDRPIAELRSQLQRLIDPGTRTSMATEMASLQAPNGGRETADFIARQVLSGPTAPQSMNS